MPLREGRQNSRIRYAVASSFLLTPLREGRLVCMSDWKRFFCTFLLTPLREGRHPRLCHARLVRAISTHAPAGGATYFRLTDDQAKKLISTHAPAGGATERALQEAEGKSYFYSRPCGRGDNTRKQKRCRSSVFLLTPLREGRLFCPSSGNRASRYPHFPPRPAHWSAVQPDAGRTLRETVGKEESAPTHPWQNQSSSAGSASQTTGSKALGLNPICTPLGTLSRETSAS